MNFPDPQPSPLFEPDPEAAYTLDVVASVSGLSSETILHYHEQGLILPLAGDEPGGSFNDETVHRLHRIEHLRDAHGMSLSALKFTLDLLDEVERLRRELRSRH